MIFVPGIEPDCLLLMCSLVCDIRWMSTLRWTLLYADWMTIPARFITPCVDHTELFSKKPNNTMRYNSSPIQPNSTQIVRICEAKTAQPQPIKPATFPLRVASNAYHPPRPLTALLRTPAHLQALFASPSSIHSASSSLHPPIWHQRASSPQQLNLPQKQRG